MSSTSAPAPTPHVTVTFVCTGNICRSPMAHVIFDAAIAQAGLSDRVHVISSGTGNWHVGDKADHRARAELNKAGYDGEQHRARQFDESDAQADLIVALDKGHLRRILDRGVDPAKVRLLRSFDPTAEPGAIVEDPYYGDDSDFTIARRQIEQAIPGLIEWVTAELDSRSCSF